MRPSPTRAEIHRCQSVSPAVDDGEDGDEDGQGDDEVGVVLGDAVVDDRPQDERVRGADDGAHDDEDEEQRQLEPVGPGEARDSASRCPSAAGCASRSRRGGRSASGPSWRRLLLRRRSFSHLPLITTTVNNGRSHHVNNGGSLALPEAWRAEAVVGALAASSGDGPGRNTTAAPYCLHEQQKEYCCD